ncbi:tRNA adenosine(34) deaminase TadA [Lactobacillus sp. ESL0731]|uniref:tRNA adenosine(34) deaminase TadA n=1 Tax=unclassified Lactobacillus TaxID=2620435 RepID=UPI0023F86661|nr:MULTISPECIES: tRNA adenosine(34) deaminase TadA [unclassified Lactobacillus]WEV50663.1 tRNA adenosine(34) deaminase TadA [Lactobacillus sp. ESL0700]WEV61793.1 tRNA adenosine(34) deaminase TadA [Lactobacillus sp. ESL0731]
MDFSSEDKKKYMQLAFDQAKKAQTLGEVPIGAVVIDPDGQVIGVGYNRRELDQDGTQHAEMMAIRQACQRLNSWRLIDCSLFVTLEPCSMCAGAIINSRIKNVFYGALDPKAGAAGSVVDLFSVEKFNHHPNVVRGLYREEASRMLKDFFQEIRHRQKLAKNSAK